MSDRVPEQTVRAVAETLHRHGPRRHCERYWHDCPSADAYEASARRVVELLLAAPNDLLAALDAVPRQALLNRVNVRLPASTLDRDRERARADAAEDDRDAAIAARDRWRKHGLEASARRKQAEDDRTRQRVRADDAERDRDGYRAALRQYGCHLEHCHQRLLSPTACTCGLRHVLEGRP